MDPTGGRRGRRGAGVHAGSGAEGVGGGCGALLETEARVLGQLTARNAAQHRGSRHAARLAGVGRTLAELARAQAAVKGTRGREGSAGRGAGAARHGRARLAEALALDSVLAALPGAAVALSALLAQTFFMAFALTALAALARIRALLADMLPVAVAGYNAWLAELTSDASYLPRELRCKWEEGSPALVCRWAGRGNAAASETQGAESRREAASRYLMEGGVCGLQELGVVEDLGVPLARAEEDLGVPIDRESSPADGALAAAAECIGRDKALAPPEQGDRGAEREGGGGSDACPGRQAVPWGADGAIVAGGGGLEAFVRAQLPSSSGGGGEGRASLQKNKRRKKGSEGPPPGPTASGASLSLQLQDIMSLVKKK